MKKPLLHSSFRLALSMGGVAIGNVVTCELREIINWVVGRDPI